MSLRVAVYLCLFWIPLSARADEPWDKAPFTAPAADILRAANEVKVPEGTDVMVLLDESRYVFDAAGRSTVTRRIVYRVINQEGSQQWSAVEQSWAPWHQDRPVVRARVITTDGVAHLLDPKTLTETPVAANQPDLFTDRRSLSGPLPAIAIGAVVEEEYVVRETAPLFARGLARFHLFGRRVPVIKARLILEAPESVALRFVTRLLPNLEPRRTESAGTVTLTFEAGPFGPPEVSEPFMPSDVPTWPYVAFTTGRTWRDVASGYHEIVEKQIAGTDLGKLPEGGQAKSRADVIERLLTRLHKEVRYTSVALGDASIVPRTPEETQRRGYGDCKDKSALLVAALRKAKIPAYVALLNTGPGLDIERDLPGFGVFDHAIVYIPGPPDLWIDATDQFARAGELSGSVQGRLALVVNTGTTDLVRIPEASSKDNRSLENREFQLSEYGKSRVIETTHLWGSMERSYRSWYERDEKEIRESLEGYAKRALLADKLEKFRHSNPNDLSKPFELVLELAEVGHGASDLREAVVGVPLAGLWANLPGFITDDESELQGKGGGKGKPWRTKDLVLPAPFLAEWQYRIVPPPGFSARALPENETRQLGPAVLSKEFLLTADGKVHATFRFDTVQRRFTPEQATALRDGLRKLQDEPNVVLGFEQVGAAHLEAGRILEALGEFRRLTEKHPREALHRIQVARALLAAGLRDAAQQEARAAVALEPSSVLAQQTLGWVLQHDWIGRRFGKGWEPKGAEDGYRKALQLEPENLETKADLAILLEHDASGRRYGPRARVGESIELYQSMMEQLKGTGLAKNLQYALMWEGRFQEMLKHARESKTPDGGLGTLVALAATEGSSAAIREASKSVAAEEQRRELLLGAGNILVGLRLYPQAADLLAAASRGSAQAAAVLGRAELMRRIKRHDTIALVPDDPASLVKHLLSIIVAPELQLDELKKIMSRYSLPELEDKEEIDRIRTLSAVLSRTAESAGMMLEVMRDIVLSTIEFSVIGEPDFGYRVRLPTEFGVGGQQVFFCVVEEGKLRVLGNAEGGLGLTVLDLIGRGDLTKARRWLDWAREENTLAGGDDPLAGPALARLWTKGGNGDAEAARWAAASLAVQSPAGAGALEILAQARTKASGEQVRLVLDLALTSGLLKHKRYDEAAAGARRLHKAAPDSTTAFLLLAHTLTQLRKWSELEDAAQEWLRRKADDVVALRTLQMSAMHRGDAKASQKYGRRLVEIGKAEGADLNNLAWSFLVEGKVTDEALQLAQRAVMRSNSEPYALHTLAALYAESDKASEARDVLLQVLKLRGDAEPTPDDWYILGRIAEHYGAREAALASYDKCEKGDGDLPDDCYQLAQRRVRMLKK